MNCPRCQSPVRAGAVFCLNCGMRIPEGAAPTPSGSENKSNDLQNADQPPKLAPPPSFGALAAGDNTGKEKSPVLVIQSGVRAGREFALDKPECTIGRVPGSDVFVEDVRVSRNHARIINRLGEFFIEDLGSANGTFVNGSQIIDPVRLKHSDMIIVGGSSLLFQQGIDDSQAVASKTPPLPNSAPASEPVQSGEDRSSAEAAKSQPGGTRTAAAAMSREVPPRQEGSNDHMPEKVSEPTPSAGQPKLGTSSDGTAPLVAAIKESRAGSIAKQAQSMLSHTSSASAEIRNAIETQRRAIQEITDRAVTVRSELDASGNKVKQLEADLTSALGLLTSIEEERLRQLAKVQENVAKLKSIIVQESAQSDASTFNELLAVIENVSANPRDIDLVAAMAKQADPIARLVKSQRSTLSVITEVVHALAQLTETL